MRSCNKEVVIAFKKYIYSVPLGIEKAQYFPRKSGLRSIPPYFLYPCRSSALRQINWRERVYLIFLCVCMFYQLLRVPHGSSSTQPSGSVLPSIVETRDQNSRGCLLFPNRNLGSFCA